MAVNGGQWETENHSYSSGETPDRARLYDTLTRTGTGPQANVSQSQSDYGHANRSGICILLTFGFASMPTVEFVKGTDNDLPTID